MKVGLDLVSYVLVLNICIAVVIVATIGVFIFGVIVSRNPEKQKPVIVAFVCNIIFLVAFLAIVVFARRQGLAPIMAALCAVLPMLSYFLSSILFKRNQEGKKMQSAWGGYEGQGSSLADLSNKEDERMMAGIDDIPQSIDDLKNMDALQSSISQNGALQNDALQNGALQNVDALQNADALQAQDTNTIADSKKTSDQEFKDQGVQLGTHSVTSSDIFPFLSDMDKTQPIKPISVNKDGEHPASAANTTSASGVAGVSASNASNADSTSNAAGASAATAKTAANPTKAAKTTKTTEAAKTTEATKTKDSSDLVAKARVAQKEKEYIKAAELYAQAAGMTTDLAKQSSLVLDEIICYTMAQEYEKAKKLANELLNSKRLDENLAAQLKEVVDLMY